MPATAIDIRPYLDDLASRIDPAQEQRIRQAWIDFLEDRCDEPLFVAPQRTPAQPTVDWPEVHINDAQAEIDLMVLSELRNRPSAQLAGTKGGALGVRCNYGTGIMATLFGCEEFTMPREMHTLPATRPLGSADAVRKLLDAGVPDLRTGLGAKVFDCAERFLQIFADYPILDENIELHHPDTQGPIDVVELVWGSDMFLGFYDEAKLMHDFLDLVTDTYIAFLQEWYRLVPPKWHPYTTHSHVLQKGWIMLRGDSLMNLSPELFVEFERPREQRCLNAFHGGTMHYCGRGDHYMPSMCEMDGLTAINLSQPHLNDMETIFRSTVDQGIMIHYLDRATAEAAIASGRDLHGRVHVW